MENENIRAILAENIQFYRKQKIMTQLELAEYLSYSDKAVSKWERGEGVPDIYVLDKLADLFDLSLDELVYKKHKAFVPQSVRNKKHLTVSLAAFVLVWIIAVTFYSIAMMANLSTFPLWYSFIVAIPISAIVLLVFSSLWANRATTFIMISVLLWSVALTLTVLLYPHLSNSYLFFIIAIPVQIGVILLGYSVKFAKKIKSRNEMNPKK